MHSRIPSLFIALLLGSSAAEAAEIRFRSQAPIAGSIVLLGDVADIQDADAEVAQRLRRLELFPSPAAGRTQTLRATEIRQLLQLHGVDARQNQFSGAGTIALTHRPVPRSTARTVTDARPASATAAPADRVVVARRPILAGEFVTAGDVELRASDIQLAAGQELRSLNDVLGREALRGFSEGQPLDRRLLRKPILVSRGQAVVVVAKAAGVEVRTTGRALEDGTHGDLVLIETLDTKQRYSGIVTGWQSAEVLASTRTVSDPPPASARITSRR